MTVDLAAYRAAHEPEPEPAAEPWTLERHAREMEGGVIGEIADRLARIESRLTRVERRGRL